MKPCSTAQNEKRRLTPRESKKRWERWICSRDVALSDQGGGGLTISRGLRGASLGGPGIVPRYNGRDKTIFSFAYGGWRLRTANTRSVSAPTPAMRQGYFSGHNSRYTVYDPNATDAKWSRIPFVNNYIPFEREGPLAKCLNSLTPQHSLAPPRVLRKMRSERFIFAEESFFASNFSPAS